MLRHGEKKTLALLNKEVLITEGQKGGILALKQSCCKS